MHPPELLCKSVYRMVISGRCQTSKTSFKVITLTNEIAKIVTYKHFPPIQKGR